MPTILKQKTVNNSTTPSARATVLIDLGNGDVKAMARMPETSDWVQCRFPSHVAESLDGNSDCLTLSTLAGTKHFLVGELAKEIQCSRTGRTTDGKVQNARVLLLHALRQMIGFDGDSIHCDVIFTSPSVKSYGPQIVEQLHRTHFFSIPADAEVIGSTQRHCVVHVHTAIPQLEGYQAFSHFQSKVKGTAHIVDIGNRTILLTQVSESGRILGRTPFDRCGVYPIAQRIRDSEALASVLMTPSIQQVIDFLLDSKQGQAVIDAITPHIEACVGEVLEQAGEGAQLFIVGGGAKLPGIEKVLGGKAVKNPQWANLTALADVATALIQRAV